MLTQISDWLCSRCSQSGPQSYSSGSFVQPSEARETSSLIRCGTEAKLLFISSLSYCLKCNKPSLRIAASSKLCKNCLEQMRDDHANNIIEDLQTEITKRRKSANRQQQLLFGGKSQATIRIERIQPRSDSVIDQSRNLDRSVDGSQQKSLNVGCTGLPQKRKLDEIAWTIGTIPDELQKEETGAKRLKRCDLSSIYRSDGKSNNSSSARILNQNPAEPPKPFHLLAVETIPETKKTVESSGALSAPKSRRPIKLTNLFRRQANVDDFDESEIDSILLAEAVRRRSKSLGDLNAQMTGIHLCPTFEDDPVFGSDWYKEKQAEIKARGGRKGQYGVVISAVIFKDRESKGWHKHQNIPTRECEEKRET